MYFLISHYTDCDVKPTFKNLSTLRKAASEEEILDVFTFIDKLIQSVAGTPWKKSKTSHLISDFINVTEEETALWIL